MLSRRLVLAGPALAGLSRSAPAQPRREDTQTDLILLAPDWLPDWVQTANGIATRLGGADVRLHAEPSRGIPDAGERLAGRPAAVSAILPSVALAYMGLSGSPARVIHAQRFIGRLGISELHVLAAQRVTGWADLSGQKINLGPQGSPTHATAAVLLERTGIRVDPLYLDHDQALAAVLRGQIAAMMVVAPAPARLFLPVNPSARVHFVPMSDPGGMPVGLLPAQILPEQYPRLGGGAVSTVGVPLVLACFNWSPATPMFAALARLADMLIERGSGLRGFDMTAEVSGWQRFPPVADWLAHGRSGAVRDVALGRRRAPPRVPSGGSGNPAVVNVLPSTEQKERLFQQFLNWRQTQ